MMVFPPERSHLRKPSCQENKEADETEAIEPVRLKFVLK